MAGGLGVVTSPYFTWHHSCHHPYLVRIPFWHAHRYPHISFYRVLFLYFFLSSTMELYSSKKTLNWSIQSGLCNRWRYFVYPPCLLIYTFYALVSSPYKLIFVVRNFCIVCELIMYHCWKLNIYIYMPGSHPKIHRWIHGLYHSDYIWVYTCMFRSKICLMLWHMHKMIHKICSAYDYIHEHKICFSILNKITAVTNIECYCFWLSLYILNKITAVTIHRMLLLLTFIVGLG